MKLTLEMLRQGRNRPISGHVHSVGAIVSPLLEHYLELWMPVSVSAARQAEQKEGVSNWDDRDMWN